MCHAPGEEAHAYNGINISLLICKPNNSDILKRAYRKSKVIAIYSCSQTHPKRKHLLAIYFMQNFIQEDSKTLG